MKNYDNVIKYLQLALKECGTSNETESLRSLIRGVIAGFEKITKKHKKIALSKLENKKIQYTHPEQTLKLIESWIEEEKNAINDN